jgi:long-chain acyl-CoA synthetase
VPSARGNRRDDAHDDKRSALSATLGLIGGYVDTLSEQLNCWEQIKKFAILDRELSMAAGELTPSLKAKRNVIVKNSADVIARLYD